MACRQLSFHWLWQAKFPPCWEGIGYSIYVRMPRLAKEISLSGSHFSAQFALEHRCIPARIGYPARLQNLDSCRSDCTTQVLQICSVPYALRLKVHQELERLVAEGIQEPMKVSDWAAPIVPLSRVTKPIHICGDFKRTVNGVSKVDCYPLLGIED